MNEMKPYLESSHYIDWHHPAILEKAKSLSAAAASQIDVAKKCFEWVRDHIKHSGDYKSDITTCKASDVLTEGTGYCYAKSHLLAALLRANNIPAGLCYQRLSRDGNGPPFCLHGLNAIYLEAFGWYRVDSRGNKQGVNAQFCPPTEKLAFNLQYTGEADLPGMWSEPLPIIVEILENNKSYEDVWLNLPDSPLQDLT